MDEASDIKLARVIYKHLKWKTKNRGMEETVSQKKENGTANE